MQKKLIKIITLIMVVTILMSACAEKPASLSESTVPSQDQPAESAPEGSEMAEDTADTSQSPTVAETDAEDPQGPQPSSTPDNRPLPENWMEWPVVPEMTASAIAVYQKGIDLGRNPRAFSKVGDCQSISEVLMGIYDIPGRYTLREEDEALEDTIRQFRGSYNRDGNAVKGGFNAASVLSPLWADPSNCLAGETPLECEIREHNPSFMIISLEVWWEGRTVERYESYMRQIIETAMQAGVVPVLSTKADNVEGDHSINYTTAKLAYEYDIPLWNFWLAVQPLDYRGIDPARDQFHITKEAWNVRSYTALQTLDNLYRAVQAVDDTQAVATADQQEQPAEQVPVVTEGVVQTETPAEEKTATPGPSPTPLGGSGEFVFGLATRSLGIYQYQGVYKFDLTTRTLTNILGAGYNLQAVSPDGSQLLVNQGSDLYKVNVDGSGLALLANGFYALGKQGAYFMPDGKNVAMIASMEGQNQVRLLPLDGSPWTLLSKRGRNPIELYPSSDPDQVVWADGSCTSYNDCSYVSALMSPVAGGMDTYMLDVETPVFSPNGDLFTYINKRGERKINLSYSTLDRSIDRDIPILGTGDIEYVLMDQSWSPQSDRVHILILQRSDYSGEWLDTRNFIITLDNLGNQEFAPISGQNPRTLWSLDGGSLLLTSTIFSEEKFQLAVRLMDIATKTVSDFSDYIPLSSGDYMLTTGLFWLP